MKTLLSKRWLIAFALASILLLAACGGTTSTADTGDAVSGGDTTTTTEEAMADETSDEAMEDGEDAMEDEAMEDEEMADEEMDDEMAGGPGLYFDVANFPTLEDGVHYEGWAIIDGAPVTTGKFNVVDGKTVGLDGEEIKAFHIEEDLGAATAIIVTIEPAGDTDTIPSETHFVAGDINADGESELTIDHPAALGTDFSDAAGQFILATPSNGNNTDEFSGVWFLDPSGPAESLTLPTLPAGWMYEGWVVIDGVPVSTGTFLTAAGADSGEPFKGPDGTPPFPGEDFLTNAPAGVTFPTDLRELPIVISVEPYPDNAPTPFVLKPLVGMAPADAADHVLYDLGLNVDDLPSASIRIS
ncbi:MAG: anti-sigma factor [Actinobacteria bacterium]|nr:anti-sigma factor [Actinomycetota bacterium]